MFGSQGIVSRNGIAHSGWLRAISVSGLSYLVFSLSGLTTVATGHRELYTINLFMRPARLQRQRPEQQ